jgi:hypothetical protein
MFRAKGSQIQFVCSFFFFFLLNFSEKKDLFHILLLPRYSRTNRVQCPKFPIFIFESDLNWFKFELFQDYEEKLHKSFPGMIFQVFKKLYRGHFLVNFPEIWSHKRKPGMILVRKQSNWNQWKIVETIYTPSQNGHFWPVLTVSSNFQKTIFRGKLAKRSLYNFLKTCGFIWNV